MNYHQSNVFLQDLSNSFHCWFNLSNCHSGVPQQFMVVFLIIILNIWRPKKSFSSILSVLSKMRGSSLMPSSHNCFWLWEFFSPIRRNSGVFQFDSLEPSFQNYSFSAFRSHSPNLTGASFKYYLISSGSLRSLVSKYPQVSSFVFQFFPVNCAFVTFILNSYGGSFKISLPLLTYQFIPYSQSFRWIVEDLPKFMLYLS